MRFKKKNKKPFPFVYFASWKKKNYLTRNDVSTKSALRYPCRKFFFVPFSQNAIP